jgi:predicted lipoprotein with Yx(FWY)xxD motif
MPSVKYLFRTFCTAAKSSVAKGLTLSLLSIALTEFAFAADPSMPTKGDRAVREVFRAVSMPQDFHVEPTELEGPVFADKHGKTLYNWPQLKLRNGYSGEAAGKVACYDEVRRVTAGLMSPYPPGLQLPELPSRPSCTDLWPPVLANINAQAIGDWSIILRTDGSRQWTYKEQPLYTSVRDKQAGDTYGGSRRKRRADGGGDGDSPAGRVPVGPPALIPPGFAIKTTSLGRMLTTKQNYAAYAFAGDDATNAACVDECLKVRKPILAPAMAKEFGEWSILERAPGVRQWVFRGAPLYTYIQDPEPWSLLGSDEPGWRNVFTQYAPAKPASFTLQNTLAGIVLADSKGKTIYSYQCGDDSIDQLACDHPEDTQVYRLAICGAGDAQRCQENWPYVLAQDSESSVNRAWKIISVDPNTGRLASADDPVAIRVWAFRDRPVYTYAADQSPGDVKGAGTGEWRGKRNGLLAFWLRDDYMKGIQ